MSIKGDPASAHRNWLMHYEGDDRAFQDVIWIICERPWIHLLNHLNELNFRIPTNRKKKTNLRNFSNEKHREKSQQRKTLYIIKFLSYIIYFYRKKHTYEFIHHKWTACRNNSDAGPNIFSISSILCVDVFFQIEMTTTTTTKNNAQNNGQQPPQMAKRLGQWLFFFLLLPFFLFLSVPSTGDDNWFPLLFVNVRCLLWTWCII